MAYVTGMLSLTLEDIDRRMVGIRQYASEVSTFAANNNTPSNMVLDVYTNFKQDRDALTASASVPGIAEYAQSQKNDQNLDVVAEFNNVIAAIDAVTSWIANNFPKDANGYLLAQTLSSTGPINRTFTPAETEGFRTVLSGLISTIE